MKHHLGYLYLHAPDPDNPGQHVTYRIVVEIHDENIRDEGNDADQNQEADNEQD